MSDPADSGFWEEFQEPDAGWEYFNINGPWHQVCYWVDEDFDFPAWKKEVKLLAKRHKVRTWIRLGKTI